MRSGNGSLELKIRVFLIATFSLIAIGTASYILFRAVDDGPQAGRGNVESGGKASVEQIDSEPRAANENRPSTGREKGRDMAPLLASKSFTELEARLIAEGYSEGEIAYFRVSAAQLCHSFANYQIGSLPLGPDGQRTRAGRSADYAKAFTDRFCEGQARPWGTEMSAIDELTADDSLAFTRELASIAFESARGEEGSGPQELHSATEKLEDILWDKDAGPETLVAAEALQALQIVSPRLAGLSEERGWGLSRSELAGAQLLAARMSVCERFGGCGPDEIYSVIQCSASASCRPGITAMAAWREAYSPTVVRAAEEMRSLVAQGN